MSFKPYLIGAVLLATAINVPYSWAQGRHKKVEEFLKLVEPNYAKIPDSYRITPKPIPQDQCNAMFEKDMDKFIAALKEYSTRQKRK